MLSVRFLFWVVDLPLLGNFFAKLCEFFAIRPLPPLPNLEIPDEVVGKAADGARVWINRALAVGHDIAIRRDRKVFLQVLLLHFFACSRIGLDVVCLTLLLLWRFLCLILKVILVLWLISYIGSLFNFLTLVYIGEFPLACFSPR